MQKRDEPKSQLAWGYYNMGLLLGVARTRTEAVIEVEARTGEPWSKARSYMEVHRVRVEKYTP